MKRGMDGCVRVPMCILVAVLIEAFNTTRHYPERRALNLDVILTEEVASRNIWLLKSEVFRSFPHSSGHIICSTAYFQWNVALVSTL